MDEDLEEMEAFDGRTGDDSVSGSEVNRMAVVEGGMFDQLRMKLGMKKGDCAQGEKEQGKAKL